MQPLSAAILFNETLKEQVDEYSEPVVRALDNSLLDLDSLIRTLIDTSKLDAGMVKPDKQDENITGLLGQLAEEFSHISKDYAVDFRTHFHEVNVLTDPTLLSRVLRNLLINAMKYGANGKVLFAARKVANQLEISVYDQGVGISDADQKVIFKEFSRLKNNFNYSYSLGLGLYIVDKMSKVLEHPIRVRSAENVGSCFTVSVPISSVKSAPVEPAALIDGFYTLPPHVITKRIWHIDNDANMRVAMQTIFANWEMEIETFSGYGQCMAVMGESFDECDLLIIDYHLDDGENGLEIAKAAKLRCPNLPIMLCTANHSKGLADELDGLDIQLLLKPVNSMMLRLSVSNLFS